MDKQYNISEKVNIKYVIRWYEKHYNKRKHLIIQLIKRGYDSDESCVLYQYGTLTEKSLP